MIKNKKPKPDTDVKAIRELLATYKSSHPRAKIAVRRRHSVCIEIRIIDPVFENMDLTDRDSMVWRVLEPLPDSAVSQITMLLLLSPKEAKTSFPNFESKHPASSHA